MVLTLTALGQRQTLANTQMLRQWIVCVCVCVCVCVWSCSMYLLRVLGRKTQCTGELVINRHGLLIV